MLLRPLYEGTQVVDFAYERLNLAGQQMLRLPAQPPATFLQLFPMAVESGVFAFYRDAFLTGKADFYGVDYRADGLNAYYQLAAQRDGAYLVVSFTDTADRRQGDMLMVAQRSRQAEQLREAHRQRADLQRLFEQAPMAITVLRGPQFIIELANLRAQASWGRSAAETLGRPLFEALPDAAGQGYEELLRGVLTSGEPLVLHEVVVNLKRSHTGLPDTGYYTILFQLLHNEYQQVTGVAVMWTEVTEQVQARQQVQDLNQELAAINEELTATNEELHESNGQLVRTNADLDTFVYTASHDLKEPATNISGLLQALRQEMPAELLTDTYLIGHLLHLLEETSARFQQTLAHLTDLTQLQQVSTSARVPLDVAAFVESVRLDLAWSLEEAQAELHIDLADCAVVHLAPKSLRSMLYNLLSNALKYRSPDRVPVIYLRLTRTPQQVVLSVQDNGLGLSPAQQGRLFRLFERLHPHIEGTGVGLYALKKLVESARGTISVESELGVGSTFTIRLPL